MSHVPTQSLHDFIVRAKQATYVGDGLKLLPYRLGSHDLQFTDGDWAYHDSYLGDRDFIGQEVVYYQEHIVWGMNYFGRILQPDRITAAQAGQVIKASLSRLYCEGRFLGGFEYSVDDFKYIDTSEGDVLFFQGREWIEREGRRVYELVYHGGVVQE
ncbi:MAG TPA: DUF5680 domain-containing protein [Anaerolineae bacterium]